MIYSQWATVRIQRGRQEQPSVPVPLPNGKRLVCPCISDRTAVSYICLLVNRVQLPALMCKFHIRCCACRQFSS